MRRSALAAILLAAAGAALGQPMAAPEAGPRADVQPAMLSGIAIEQRLNEAIPGDLSFRDEVGRPVVLSDYFGSRPIVLALVYYNCPMLCTEVLNGLVSALRVVSLTAGRDFDVVVVSFDPREKPADAAAKKIAYVRRYRHQGGDRETGLCEGVADTATSTWGRLGWLGATQHVARVGWARLVDAAVANNRKIAYVGRYGRPGSDRGWHFLTGAPEAIGALARSVGFHYRFDADQNQFAHASAIYVLTPAGRLSRYFLGIEYAPRDLRLALVEASEGAIGTPVDRLLLYCFHYDPKAGKYSAAIVKIVRATGIATLAAIVFAVVRMSRRRSARLRLVREGAR